MPSTASMPAFSSRPAAQPHARLGGPVAARSATSQGPGRTIVVAEGETLISIARRYDVPMSILLDHNTLRSLSLTPGTELFVPQLRPSYQR